MRQKYEKLIVKTPETIAPQWFWGFYVKNLTIPLGKSSSYRGKFRRNFNGDTGLD